LVVIIRTLQEYQSASVYSVHEVGEFLQFRSVKPVAEAMPQRRRGAPGNDHHCVQPAPTARFERKTLRPTSRFQYGSAVHGAVRGNTALRTISQSTTRHRIGTAGLPAPAVRLH
jgi:hypothetical protein